MGVNVIVGITADTHTLNEPFFNLYRLHSYKAAAALNLSADMKHDTIYVLSTQLKESSKLIRSYDSSVFLSGWRSRETGKGQGCEEETHFCWSKKLKGEWKR